MSTLFHVSLCDDDDVGEVEGFFDDTGECLASWCLNDAEYRNEYMDPLFAALGYEVRCTDDAALVQKLKDRWLELES